MTSEIVIALDPRPGTLAQLLGGLAKENVNIRGGFGTNLGDFDTWHMIVDDTAKAESILRKQGTRYQVHDVAVTTLPDKPGTLLRATERLAGQGINIEAVYNLATTTPGECSVAFRVKDSAAAERALRG